MLENKARLSLKKSIGLSLVGIILLLLILIPAFNQTNYPVSADSNITINSSVKSAYPDSMTFNVSAKSSAKITQLRLHYQVNHQNFANVISEGWAQFTPATNVSSQWFWDMRKASLPPGTQVQYWWTALDSQGNSGQTSVSAVTFDDSRYNWQTLTTGPVILEWYNENSQFANTLMTAAQQGVQRIESNVGAVPQGHVMSSSTRISKTC